MLLFVGFLHNSCNKCNPWGDCELNGTFIIQDTLILKSDTISTQDTVWLMCSISDTLPHENKNLLPIYYPNAEMEIDPLFTSISATPHLYAPEVLNEIGDCILHQYGVIIKPIYQNARYIHKTGFVFSTPGIYLIRTSKDRAHIQGNCECDDIKIKSVINIENRNLYLLPKEQYEGYDTTIIAAFVVK